MFTGVELEVECPNKSEGILLFGTVGDPGEDSNIVKRLRHRLSCAGVRSIL